VGRAAWAWLDWVDWVASAIDHSFLLHDLRGGSTNWTFDQVEARFACGSMVHFDLFSQKICTVCKFFVKKDGFFRPAGGGISCQVNDCVTPVF
jgi:hypothetical protein